MDCPPIKLDGTVPGMEAVRVCRPPHCLRICRLTLWQFQYMNLARYAQQVTRYWKGSQHKQQAVESAYSKERKQRRQVQSELLDVKARVETLEKGESQLKKWEARKPVINHYLSVVGEMAKSVPPSLPLGRLEANAKQRHRDDATRTISTWLRCTATKLYVRIGQDSLIKDHSYSCPV